MSLNINKVDNQKKNQVNKPKVDNQVDHRTMDKRQSISIDYVIEFSSYSKLSLVVTVLTLTTSYLLRE